MELPEGRIGTGIRGHPFRVSFPPTTSNYDDQCILVQACVGEAQPTAPDRTSTRSSSRGPMQSTWSPSGRLDAGHDPAQTSASQGSPCLLRRVGSSCQELAPEGLVHSHMVCMLQTVIWEERLHSVSLTMLRKSRNPLAPAQSDGLGSCPAGVWGMTRAA